MVNQLYHGFHLLRHHLDNRLCGLARSVFQSPHAVACMARQEFLAREFPIAVWLGISLTQSFQLTAIISFGYAAFSSNMFFLALFLQKIRSMSPLLVAVHLLPQVIGGILINIIAGLLMHRISNKLLIALGAVCYVFAFTLLGVMQEDSSYWTFIFPALCLSVVGADFEFTVTNMYVMSSLPLAQQSVAGGLFNTIMRLSSSVGFAVSTAVFNGVDASGADESNLSSDYAKYRATFFVSLASSGLSLFLLPFLTLKSQGGRSQRG